MVFYFFGTEIKNKIRKIILNYSSCPYKATKKFCHSYWCATCQKTFEYLIMSGGLSRAKPMGKTTVYFFIVSLTLFRTL